MNKMIKNTLLTLIFALGMGQQAHAAWNWPSLPQLPQSIKKHVTWQKIGAVAAAGYVAYQAYKAYSWYKEVANANEYQLISPLDGLSDAIKQVDSKDNQGFVFVESQADDQVEPVVDIALPDSSVVSAPVVSSEPNPARDLLIKEMPLLARLPVVASLPTRKLLPARELLPVVKSLPDLELSPQQDVPGRVDHDDVKDDIPDQAHAVEQHVWIFIHGTQEFAVGGYVVKPMSAKLAELLNADDENGVNLIPAKDIDPKKNDSLRRVDETLVANGLANCSTENFYYVVWNGRWSDRRRNLAAESLRDKLIELKRSYVERGVTPILHIITHSYGGDVVLKLASSLRTDLVIDEFIMLACPIRKTAEVQIYNEQILPRVMNFYSLYDGVQNIDLQGAQKSATSETPWFTQRTFGGFRNGLVEFQVDNELKLGHSAFHRVPFLTQFPELYREAQKQYKDIVGQDLSASCVLVCDSPSPTHSPAGIASHANAELYNADGDEGDDAEDVVEELPAAN